MVLSWLLATNSNCLLPLSLQHHGLHLGYLKLWLFDLTEFIVLNIMGGHYRAAKVVTIWFQICSLSGCKGGYHLVAKVVTIWLQRWSLSGCKGGYHLVAKVVTIWLQSWSPSGCKGVYHLVAKLGTIVAKVITILLQIWSLSGYKGGHHQRSSFFYQRRYI